MFELAIVDKIHCQAMAAVENVCNKMSKYWRFVSQAEMVLYSLQRTPGRVMYHAVFCLPICLLCHSWDIGDLLVRPMPGFLQFAKQGIR